MRLFIRPILLAVAAFGLGVGTLLAQGKPEDQAPKDDGKGWLQKAVDEQEKIQQSHNQLETDKDLLKDTENKGEVKTPNLPATGANDKKPDASTRTDINGVKQPADNKTQIPFQSPDKTAPPNAAKLPGSFSNSNNQKSATPGLTPLTPFSSFTTGGINSLSNGQPTSSPVQSNDPAKAGLNFGMDLPKANPLLALPDYESSKHSNPDNSGYSGYTSYGSQPNGSANSSGGNYSGYGMSSKPAKAPSDMTVPGSDAYMKNLFEQSNQPLQAPKPMNAGAFNPQSLHSMDNPQSKPAAQPLTFGLQPPARHAVVVSQPAGGQTRIVDPNDFLDR